MKKIVILLMVGMLGASSFASVPPAIDEKVLQSFKTIFPNVRGENWYEFPDTYQVYFENEGIKTRITYWKDGLYVQFLRYYLEQNLPSYVQYKVKKEYPDKTISSITELSTISGPDKNLKVEYNIKMEDPKNWILVRLDSEGNLKVVERYRKL